MDIASVHSDGGSEFNGALSKYCLEHGIRKTDSGRYRPELNVIAENRIKTGYQRVRAMLGTCTGGADYYDELAGPALARANFLINRVPWTTGTDPYKALNGGTYQRDSRDHIFGCLVAPLIPKEIRANSLAPVAKIGVYLGSSEKTPGAIILATITFDYEHMRWVLHAPEEATSYKAFDSIFPLRLLPTAGGRTLDQFIEGVIPWQKQSQVPEGITVTGDNIGASSGVYKVRKILDREKRKGGYHYLVGWAGYGAEENSWEPRRNLVKYGSTQLVERFDATRKTTLKSQLCQARGDDAAGRTSTLMDEVYRFMEDMEMPVYQAERAQRAAEAASQGTTQMTVQATYGDGEMPHQQPTESAVETVGWKKRASNSTS
jgi:hypothetical protein